MNEKKYRYDFIYNELQNTYIEKYYKNDNLSSIHELTPEQYQHKTIKFKKQGFFNTLNTNVVHVFVKILV